MKIIAVLLFFAASAFAFIAPIGPNQIEGPNVPDQPYIAYSGHDCLPEPGDFTRCLAFVRGPNDTSGEPANPGAGTQAYSACQYSESDPLPSLPVGIWDVTRSQCSVGQGANCTAWLFSSRHTGGDGGCWMQDSTIAAFLVQLPAPIVTHGHCVARENGTLRCRWKNR